MTDDDRDFFRELGARIAKRRKELGITQAQLGTLLGYSQQQIASFELGRSRVPLSLLPTLARSLSLSAEEVLGHPREQANRRGPAPKLAQQMERIQRLPRAKQRFVVEMLDTVLAQAGQ